MAAIYGLLKSYTHIGFSCYLSGNAGSLFSQPCFIAPWIRVSQQLVLIYVFSDEMSQVVQQLALESNGVGEFLAQTHCQNRRSLPERMATTEQSTTTKRSSSCPEDLSKKCTNSQQKDEDNEKSKRNSDKGPSRETWELDSGTHDLGNYEPALQQLMSAANAKGQSRSSNFLELANTVSELIILVC